MSDETLQALDTMIREVVAEDWILEVPITRETAFNRDLELESLEFVALAERLQQEYGARVDFVGWLSSRSLDEIVGMTVGELVDFIDGSPAAGR